MKRRDVLLLSVISLIFMDGGVYLPSNDLLVRIFYFTKISANYYES